MNQKYDKYSKYSSNNYILKTEQKGRNIAPFEQNVGDRLILSVQDFNNRQKLIDFISDKKKLSLKSYFDHRGTKAFLNGKDEAMKRIELNENIEENIKSKKSHKNIKKLNHRKSADFSIDFNNLNEMAIKEESIKKKKSKKPKSILTKLYNKDYKNKLDEIKEKFEDFELEKLLWQPQSPTNKRKRRKLIENKKTKNIKLNNNKYNTIATLDSKLLNSIKEKESVKSLLSKDDDIIKDILYELDSNKK